MRDFFPSKSLFGFEILNSLHSTLAAYTIITWLLIQIIIFNYFGISSWSSNCFILIANISSFILIFNAIMRRKKNSNIIYWVFLNFPLWVYLPFLIRMIYLSTLQIFI